MSYQEQSDQFRSQEYRTRAEMCVREQALIFSGSEAPAVAALGRGVTAGDWVDIDAVLAAVSVHQNWSQIPGDDVALLGAVQDVWPSVAAARYPQPA